MRRKIPLILWLFQLIVVLILIANLYSLFQFAKALFSSFRTSTFVGTSVNLIILAGSLFTILGIWMKARTARLAVIIYSYALFLFSVISFVVAYTSYTPADLQTQYRISNIIIYSVVAVALLSLPISIQKSEKVIAYFSASE